MFTLTRFHCSYLVIISRFISVVDHACVKLMMFTQCTTQFVSEKTYSEDQGNIILQIQDNANCILLVDGLNSIGMYIFPPILANNCHTHNKYTTHY